MLFSKQVYTFWVKSILNIEITLVVYNNCAMGFPFKLAKWQRPHNNPKTKH